MQYLERERKNEENANFVHIVYLLDNIFDEAFSLTSVYNILYYIKICVIYHK